MNSDGRHLSSFFILSLLSNFHSSFHLLAPFGLAPVPISYPFRTRSRFRMTLGQPDTTILQASPPQQPMCDMGRQWKNKISIFKRQNKWSIRLTASSWSSSSIRKTSSFFHHQNKICQILRNFRLTLHRTTISGPRVQCAHTAHTSEQRCFWNSNQANSWLYYNFVLLLIIKSILIDETIWWCRSVR